MQSSQDPFWEGNYQFTSLCSPASRAEHWKCKINGVAWCLKGETGMGDREKLRGEIKSNEISKTHPVFPADQQKAKCS